MMKVERRKCRGGRITSVSIPGFLLSYKEGKRRTEKGGSR